MLFNSLTFLVFLPVVFGLYWSCGCKLWLQNLLVVIASYVFYGWWDWRFLVLIAFTSLWSYAVGCVELNRWDSSRCGRKWLLACSLIVNLGILAIFKYFNFFVDSAAALLEMFGFCPHLPSLQIILPVGISFYTFQALSYTIDIYRHQIRPTRDALAFLAFISFFPQLVAGPIERATNLLPQFLRPRRFDYALSVEGCRQMLWGFFKKCLVADNCAMVANRILGNADAGGFQLWVGMVCFAFQIYGDFSGYSDIAIGCSKLFGIRLMRNFNCPYFSRDIAEFWRRWHISLTTWFRDYLYIPLGGSRCGVFKKIRNTFAIFLVSGLWHGANWTFVLWGVFHAVCFLPLFVLGKNRKHVGDIVAEERIIPSWNELAGMLLTFLLVVIGWTFFRAPDVLSAFHWLGRMFSSPGALALHGLGLTRVVLALATMLLVEWGNRGREIPRLPRNRCLRWGVYYVMTIALLFARPEAQTFIYFKF